MQRQRERQTETERDEDALLWEMGVVKGKLERKGRGKRRWVGVKRVVHAVFA
jgi:hypothetical protein